MFSLIAKYSLAKDAILPPGFTYAYESPSCNVEQNKCDIPKEWKGLNCISIENSDDVGYLINVSDKYIIEPKIDEYEIIFKAEELELTLNEILFREMSDKEYAFKINRESLRKESFFLGIWQCEVVLPFNILEPIIDKIISSKNKNKL